MCATLSDGSSGYALAPTVRGHTTLIEDNPARFLATGPPSVDAIKEATPLVFRPLAEIRWPKHCISCFLEDASDGLVVGVYSGTENTTEGIMKRAVFLGWWTPAVTLIESTAKAAAMSKAGEVRAYTLPVCSRCKNQLSRKELSELESSPGEVFTPILHKRIFKRCVSVRFQSPSYDAAFRRANAGRVYDSVDECLGVKKAATAAKADGAKEAKMVPCEGCARMISNGKLVCPHCGHTQWKRIVSYFLVGVVLLGVGYEFCGPGVWRWIWWILGALLSFTAISGVVTSIRWRENSSPSSAMATPTELSGSEQLAPGAGNASAVRRSGNNRIKKTWICPKCNVAVDLPKISDNKRRTCDLGHKLEQPMGFLGGLLAPLSFFVIGAVLTHVVGGIWNYPAKWISALTMFGVGVAPWVGLVKGVVNFARGGMARRLASGFFGLTFGAVVMAVLFGLVMAGAITSGAPRCTSPDQPYLTSTRAERIYRFFLPYGIDVQEDCASKQSANGH